MRPVGVLIGMAAGHFALGNYASGVLMALLAWMTWIFVFGWQKK